MRTFIFIFVCVTLMWGFFSCLDNKSDAEFKAKTGVTAAVEADAKSGLDLQALMGLAKTVKNGEELEKKLNEPEGINNLDLNEDDVVDYIAVAEYGNKDAWGFSLTTEPEQGQVQEVATLEFERQPNEQVKMSTTGSRNIYGPSMTYMAVSSVANVMMWSYLLNRTGPYYHSPYRWGFYPSYYHPYRYSSYSSYHSRTRSYASSTRSTRVTTARTSPLSSPNKGRVANSGVKKSLATPTKAQKSFQTRNPSKAVKSGGFGRSSSSSSSKSARSSSSSRGFGGRGK